MDTTTGPVQGDVAAVGPEALPRAFQVCDAAAREAQNGHHRLVRLHIWMGLVLASAAQMLYSLTDALNAPPVSLGFPRKVWLIPLGLGVLITLRSRFMLRSRQWERIWHRSRATAEQIRGCAWRYMMGVDPHGAGEPDARDAAEVRADFMAGVDAIKKDWAKLGQPGISHRADLPEITPAMDALRAAPFAAKVRAYTVARVRDQIDWFERRAREHLRSHRFFSVLTQTFEFGAMVFALLLILDATGLYRLPTTVPVAWTTFLWPCLTGAAASMAWTGYRRYQETAVSYGAHAEELVSVKQQLDDLLAGAPDAVRLARLVDRCEGVLAAENRLWLTRREG